MGPCVTIYIPKEIDYNDLDFINNLVRKISPKESKKINDKSWEFFVNNRFYELVVSESKDYDLEIYGHSIIQFPVRITICAGLKEETDYFLLDNLQKTLLDKFKGFSTPVSK